MEEFEIAKDERAFLDSKRNRHFNSSLHSKGDERTRERYRTDFKKPSDVDSRNSSSRDRLHSSATDTYDHKRREHADGNGNETRHDSHPRYSLTRDDAQVSSLSKSSASSSSSSSTFTHRQRTLAIPSVLPLTAPTTAITTPHTDTSHPIEKNDVVSRPVLSKDELNKLNARILKAKLMGLPEDPELVAMYEREKKRAEDEAGGGVHRVIQSSVSGVHNLPLH